MAKKKSSTGVGFTPLDTKENERLDSAERIGRRQGRREGAGLHRKQSGSGELPIRERTGETRRPASGRDVSAAPSHRKHGRVGSDESLPLTTKKRASPLKVGLIVLNALLLTAVVAAGAVFGVARHRIGQLKTYDLTKDGLVAPPAGAPFNILLVGSDSRANQEHPEVAGQRSDTMMIVRLDPVRESAQVLSIPRDLRVLDNHGNIERINAKFSGQGSDAPKNLIKGIQHDLGIPVHHYVQVDFESFKALVDSIDGVNIYLTEHVRDRNSGFGPAGPGCVHLDGESALAYARSRHTEVKNPKTGRWGNDVGADGERIKRQQDLLRRIVRKSVDKGLTNPVVANRLIDAMIQNVTVDSAMTTARMKTIVQQMRNVNAGNIPMYTLPGADVTKSGGDYKGGGGYDGLRLLPEATPVLAQFGSKLVVGEDYPHNQKPASQTAQAGSTTAKTNAKTSVPATTAAGVSTTVVAGSSAAQPAPPDTKPPQGSDPSKECPA